MKIPDLEWSGVLFYSIAEGTISDPDNMVIQLQDILLMDIGNKVHTEYNWDEVVVQFQMQFPESIYWLKGHIHSHNSMSTFFSGEDMSELNDNAPYHNIYLSVIVNNYLDIKAKIALAGIDLVPPISNYRVLDENGQPFMISIDKNPPPDYEKPSVMLVYDCEVSINSDLLPKVPDQFANRYDEVKKIKIEQNSKPKYPVPAVTTNQGSPLSSSKGPTFIYEGGEDLDSKQIFDLDSVDGYESEMFACFILRGGIYVQNDSFERVMTLVHKQKNSPAYCSSVVENFHKNYADFFVEPDFDPKVFSTFEVKDMVLDDLIDFLYSYDSKHFKYAESLGNAFVELKDTYAENLKNNLKDSLYAD